MNGERSSVLEDIVGATKRIGESLRMKVDRLQRGIQRCHFPDKVKGFQADSIEGLDSLIANNAAAGADERNIKLICSNGLTGKHRSGDQSISACGLRPLHPGGDVNAIGELGPDRSWAWPILPGDHEPGGLRIGVAI